MRLEWSHKLGRSLRVYPTTQEAADARKRGEKDVLAEHELQMLIAQKPPKDVLAFIMLALNELEGELWYAGKDMETALSPMEKSTTFWTFSPVADAGKWEHTISPFWRSVLYDDSGASKATTE